MADTTLTLNPGSGGSNLALDAAAGGELWQYVKLGFGASGTQTRVSSADPLPVGIFTAAGDDCLDDTADAVKAILQANSGVDIGDVDVTSFPSTVHSADFDSGAGTDTTLAFGIAVPASGGAAVVPGNATAGLKVDLGADNDVTLATLPDTATGDLAAINTAVSGTLTVGSHAVTNAGTFAVQVDGAALTALQLIDNALLQDDAPFTPATGFVAMAGAEFDDVTPDSVDEGDGGALRMSSRRELYVQIRDAAGNERGLNIDASGRLDTVYGASNNTALTSMLAALQVIDDWDQTDRCAVNPIASQVGVQGASGVVTALTQRVVLATDVGLPAGTNAIGKLAANSGIDIGDVDVTSLVPGTGATALGKAEDALHASGDTGVMALAVRNDVLAALAGTDGDYAPLQVNADGALFVQTAPAGTGGLTFYKNLDVDESEDQISATACQLYWIHAMNLAATVRYLKLYNATAATVVVGTTAPDLTIPLPTQGNTNGAGTQISIPNGIAFSTALTVAATTGVADADAGAPGANDVVISMGYKA